MATKQQDPRTETSNPERTERPATVERLRAAQKGVASWFSFGDWRTRSTSSEEWALA